MQRFIEMTAFELYKKWGSKEPGFPGVDDVVYWHDDSEVEGLVLQDGYFDIEYADGTVTEISTYETILVQTIVWNTTRIGQIAEWIYYWGKPWGKQ